MMLFERNYSYEERNDFPLLEDEECYSETHRSIPSFICGNSTNNVPDVNDMLETYEMLQDVFQADRYVNTHRFSTCNAYKLC